MNPIGPRPSTQSPERTVRSVILLAGVCVILGLWAAVFYFLELQRQLALEQARRDTANLARVLEEQLIRTFAGIDQRMLFLRRDYEKDPQHFDMAEWLKGAPAPEDVGFQIGITGPDGFLTSSSLGPITNPVNISDRDHFKAHLVDGKDELFISRPLLTR